MSWIYDLPIFDLDLDLVLDCRFFGIGVFFALEL